LPQTLIYNDYRDFGPRLGMAYRAGERARAMVVRGGYRLSYFPLPVRSWGVTMRSNTPSTARFFNSPNAAERSPDGVRNYLMRSAPTIVAGKNSSDVVSLNDPKSGLVAVDQRGVGTCRGGVTARLGPPWSSTSAGCVRNVATSSAALPWAVESPIRY
jgi:hypothetical protein